jgi:hypothetical protein
VLFGCSHMQMGTTKMRQMDFIFHVKKDLLKLRVLIMFHIFIPYDLESKYVKSDSF